MMSTIAWLYVAITLAVALATALLAAEPAAPEGDGGGPIPHIEVALLETPEQVKGLAWPRQEDGDAATLTAVDEPRKVIIRLPGGAAVAHFSRVTSLAQDEGAVTDVTIVPHARALSYQDVISLLEDLLERWGAELTNVSKPRVKRWKSQGDVPPGPFLRRTAGALIGGEGKVKLFLRLRPVESGWFLSVNIAATAEARREATKEDAAKGAIPD